MMHRSFARVWTWILALALTLAGAIGGQAVAASPERAPPHAPPALRPSSRDLPSRVVYPSERWPIVFSHKRHISRGVGCETCHARAKESRSSSDRLLPDARACDGCHGTNHSSLRVSGSTKAPFDRCQTCHGKLEGGRVRRILTPKRHVIFDHRAHARRNIGCMQCHAAAARVDLMTRDDLPTMKSCLRCHGLADKSARGDAKATCTTCHERRGPREHGGAIRTRFPEGQLFPPRWLGGAEHSPDFITRHKRVAANDSRLCAGCHDDDSCTACHDGRVRPRQIHPGDYLSMHAAEAQMAASRCDNCHRAQTFCVTCHQRVGIAQTGPRAGRSSGRFHPPKSIWSDSPRGPGHHALEAQRNMDACVSCHTERDCVACHGGRGRGAGLSPHPAGFAASCGRMMRQNPRPCLVCHEPGDAKLGECR